MGGGFGIYYKDAAAPVDRGLREGRGARPARDGLPPRARARARDRRQRRRAADARALPQDVGRQALRDRGRGDERPDPAEPLRLATTASGRWSATPPPPLGTEPDLPLHDIVGPVCESGDFLAKDRPVPARDEGRRPARGDERGRLRLRDGEPVQRARPARPRSSSTATATRVARRRETYADLVRGEDARPGVKRVGGRRAPRRPPRRRAKPAKAAAKRPATGGRRRPRRRAKAARRPRRRRASAPSKGARR